MAIKPNQLEVQFFESDKEKLDTVEEGAQVNPEIASQMVAEGGIDNAQMMTALRVKQAIDVFAGASGEVNTASNVGMGTGLFKEKVAQDLQFKSIIAGDNVTFDVGTDSITINVEADATGHNLASEFTNETGDQLLPNTPVRQDGDGDMATIDVSDFTHVSRTLGILTETTEDGDDGLVVLSGLIENVSTSILIGSTVYLSKAGGFTATPPEIGGGGFVEGDYIVQLGQVTKNALNPMNKDFLVDVQIIGQL